MQYCRKCAKKFTVTSWTRDNFWREVCPKCIVELLENNGARNQVLASDQTRATSGGSGSE